MTKQEIYDQIVVLTAKIKATSVAEKIIEAAKTGDPAKVENVFKTFEKENQELYQKIISLGDAINENASIEPIFDEIGDEFAFDTEKIDVLNFYVLLFFIDTDDYDLFYNWVSYGELIDEALRLEGNEKLSNFLEKYCIFADGKVNIYETLVGIYTGMYEDYEEDK